jgi:DNA-directed RNA polymerase subunit alpha
MAVLYGKFEMPKKIIKDEESKEGTYARFLAEPFERTFGHTIANGMRRVMLSSLEAPGVVGVRIEGVTHEYQPIDGVIEDMTNVVLNFKGALLRRLPMEADGDIARDQRMLTTVLDITQEDLDAGNGQKEVCLGDVIQSGDFDVINPELHLFTVTKPFKRQVDVRVGIGRGYVPSERHIVHDRNVDEVIVDTAFSPVRLVNYYVENTRVGQDTDYDRLVFEVTTDGRLTPQEALSFAAQVCIRQLAVLQNVEEKELKFEEGERSVDRNDDEMLDKLCLRIDEIELSVRSTNCLSGANIETIAELVSIPERRMLEFRNFGKKSLNEIKAKLSEMGLSLGMDLTRYGIDPENLKETMTALIEERRANAETSHFDETGVM